MAPSDGPASFWMVAPCIRQGGPTGSGELERPLMVRVGCRGSEDGNAGGSSMSGGRGLAGWLEFLSAAWSRGKLDFGSSALILSLFMHLFLGDLHYFLVCVLIIFYISRKSM